MEQSQIEQLHQHLVQIQDGKVNEDVYNWLNEICQPDFGLIDGLVANFIENIDDSEFSKKLLKVLKKLNEFIPDLVVPQFLQNKSFPGAIIKYIEQTKFEVISGDSFTLLVNVFNDEALTLINDKFIQKLIDSTQYISDESTLNAVIGILIIIFAETEKKIKKSGKSQTNLVLKDFLQNENFYRHKILELANRSNAYRFDKSMATCRALLSKKECAGFFNNNDMNLLLDICVLEVQRQKQEKVRVQILKAIDSIMRNEVFLKYPYKVKETQEVMKELILYEDPLKQYGKKEKDLIQQISQYLDSLKVNQ